MAMDNKTYYSDSFLVINC